MKELVAELISCLNGHFKSLKCKVTDQPDVKESSINYTPIILGSLQKKIVFLQEVLH